MRWPEPTRAPARRRAPRPSRLPFPAPCGSSSMLDDLKASESRSLPHHCCRRRTKSHYDAFAEAELTAQAATSRGLERSGRHPQLPSLDSPARHQVSLTRHGRLARMPRVQGNGVRVHYESAGAGAPVVCLVHGTGGTGGVWTRQLEGLADVAHVVAPTRSAREPRFLERAAFRSDTRCH